MFFFSFKNYKHNYNLFTNQFINHLIEDILSVTFFLFVVD